MMPINEIGQQMTLLFKDEPLYEKELINNPNFKLQSLRDFSGLELINQIGAPAQDAEEQQNEKEEIQSAAKFKYLSDESLYD